MLPALFGLTKNPVSPHHRHLEYLLSEENLGGEIRSASSAPDTNSTSMLYVVCCVYPIKGTHKDSHVLLDIAVSSLIGSPNNQSFQVQSAPLLISFTLIERIRLSRYKI